MLHRLYSVSLFFFVVTLLTTNVIKCCGRGLASTKQAIQDDNIAAFREASKTISFSADDVQGTLLLLEAALADRSRRTHTMEFIKTLLDKGANPEIHHTIASQQIDTQQTEHGWHEKRVTSYITLPTAIDAAILAGNAEAVEALGQKGVDVTRTHMHQSSVLHTMLRMLTFDPETPLEHVERYLDKEEGSDPACLATHDELHDIAQILEHYAQRQSESSCFFL